MLRSAKKRANVCSKLADLGKDCVESTTLFSKPCLPNNLRTTCKVCQDRLDQLERQSVQLQHFQGAVLWPIHSAKREGIHLALYFPPPELERPDRTSMIEVLKGPKRMVFNSESSTSL